MRALDGVTLDIYAGEFTAVMGPSGSGQVDADALLRRARHRHQRHGRSSATPTLSRLKDKELTRLRRDQVGFVFQSFNLVPTLTAEENILLPLSIAGRKPDAEWYDTVIDTVGLARPARATGPTSCPAASSSGSRWPGRWSAGPSIVFADEPTGNLDSRSGAEVLTLLKRSVDEFGQTVVMVTHDPVAAGYTDRVVFLADGQVVDEMREPTAERVLERMTLFTQPVGAAPPARVRRRVLSHAQGDLAQPAWHARSGCCSARSRSSSASRSSPAR